MPTDTFVQNFVISKISRSKFEELSSSGMLNENEFYLIEDPQIDAGNQPIVNVSAPSSGTDAANKDYVDGASSAIAADIATLSSAMSSKADQSAFAEFASTTSASLSALNSNKANLASPSFTGTPTAPTASSGTSSTQIATTAFVQNVADNLRDYDIDACVFYGTITGNDGVTITSSFSDAWAKVTAGFPVFLALVDLDFSGSGQRVVLSTSGVVESPPNPNPSYDSIISFSIPRNNGICTIDWGAVQGDEANTYVDTAFTTEHTVFNVNADLNLSTMTISNADSGLDLALSALSQGAVICLTLNGVYRGWSVGAYDSGSVSSSWITFTVMLDADLGNGSHPYMLTATWANDGIDDTWDVVVKELAQTSEIPDVSDFLNENAVADEFSESSTYSVGDIVVYGGLRYKCTTDVSSEGSWTGDSNWSLETIQEAIEDIDVSSQIKGKMDANSVSNAWSDVAAYSVGDVVEYEGALYKCNTAIAAASSDSSNSWDSSLWDLTSVDIVSKLEQEAVAPVFNGASTYFANDYVTYNGVLYKCVNAKTTASNITPENDIYNASSASANHWEVTDMTSPDATVDIMTGGELRVVAADGTILWAEGYNLSEDSSSTVQNWAVKGYTFAANATGEVALSLPSVMAGKVGDFVLDVTNPDLNTTSLPTAFSTSSIYAAGDIVSYDSKIWRCVVAVETAGAWTGTTNWEEAWPYITLAQVTAMTASVVVPAGEDLNDMLKFAPGTMCELYFTQTAFNVDSKPTWKVVRQDVEDGGAS